MSSDRLPPLIAIRKTPHTLRAGKEESSLADRRSFMNDVAQSSTRSERLEEIGFRALSPSMQKDEVPAPKNGYVRLGHVGAYIINADTDQSREDAASELQPDYFVLSGEQLLSLPTTQGTKKRSDKGPAARAKQWPEWTNIRVAHEEGIKGAGVKVMLLDTGCDADHAQFSGRTSRIKFQFIDPRNPARSRDKRGFDTDGHGTHVSSIIAGKDIGVSPEVDLFVASVIESETVLASLQRILVGLDWLIREANHSGGDEPFLLNMSLGFLPEHLNHAHSQLLMESMESVIQNLVTSYGILPIIAIGNDGEGRPRVPGMFRDVLSVGATNSQRNRWGKTSTATIEREGVARQLPEIWGVGEDVYAALERNGDNDSVYAVKTGTSMAAPFVTGIAALNSIQHGIYGQELKKFLIDTAIDGCARFVPK